MSEEIILVNNKDEEIGYGEKLQVHLDGKLHRAFSIYIFNSKHQLLIQKRAMHKYHSPGIIANSCCSHPRKGELLKQAVHRRLKEELGFDTDLKEIFSFVYNALFENDLTENEFLHVFIGEYDSVVNPNPSEVAEVKWINIPSLLKEIKDNPEKYAVWLKMALPKVLSYWKTFST